MAFLSNLGSKAAHSPKFSIGGSADLKALNSILSTEKAVLTATSKLSIETKRAGDALREYGVEQGDDLRDVLAKVAQLFEQLSRAQIVFTEHEETYRAHFKAVRTREEAYAQLRKSNDTLAGKIDSAERTLAKTSQEHKERETRERKLYELRQEKVGLENAVAKEDAELYDYKREVTRMALSLRLGALQEMSEKGTVVAEMGKLLIAEIPRERTPIGGAHPLYYGDQDTDKVMREAERCLSAVTFNPRPDLLPASPSGPNQSGTFTSTMSGGRAGQRDSFADSQASPSRNANRGSAAAPLDSYAPQLQSTLPVTESTASDAYDAYFAGSPTSPVNPSFQPTLHAPQSSEADGYQPSPLSKAYAPPPPTTESIVAQPSSAGHVPPFESAAAPHEAVEMAPRTSLDAHSARGSGYATPPSIANSGAGRIPPPAAVAAAPAVYPGAPPPPPTTRYDTGSSSQWERANGVTIGAVPPPAPRPNYARGDSALGSRHGYDSAAYGGPQPLDSGSRYPTVPSSGGAQALGPIAGSQQYSYHPAGSAGQPRTMNAGAFRKSTNNATSPIQPANDGPSPAALIREAYLSQSQPASSSQFGGPMSPVVPESTPPLRLHKRDGESMQQPSIPIDGWHGADAPPAPPAYGSSAVPAPLVAGSGPNRVPAAPPAAESSGSGMRYVTRLD